MGSYMTKSKPLGIKKKEFTKTLATHNF